MKSFYYSQKGFGSNSQSIRRRCCLVFQLFLIPLFRPTKTIIIHFFLVFAVNERRNKRGNQNINVILIVECYEWMNSKWKFFPISEWVCVLKAKPFLEKQHRKYLVVSEGKQQQSERKLQTILWKREKKFISSFRKVINKKWLLSLSRRSTRLVLFRFFKVVNLSLLHPPSTNQTLDSRLVKRNLYSQ